MLGSGAIVVMDETTDAVQACLAASCAFFAHESCGKCTPCREGTGWLEKILDRIVDGHGRPEDLDLLLDVGDNITPGHRVAARQTTICPLGPSAVVADRVGARRASATSSRPTSARRRRVTGDVDEPRRRCRRTPRRRPKTTVTVTIDGKRDRGARRASCSSTPRERARRLHPALLLPPADEAGRHVPHVPRRGRRRPRLRAAAVRA